MTRNLTRPTSSGSKPLVFRVHRRKLRLLAAVAALTLGVVVPAAADQLVYQSAPGLGGVPDLAEIGDRFGEVIATGDFNCDHIDDLAVGDPTEDANAGAAVLMYGSSTGLNLTAPVRLVGVAGDLMGTALAAGDYTGDSCDDLAVGLPGNTGGFGQVNVYSGSTTGIATAANFTFATGTGFGRLLATEHGTWLHDNLLVYGTAGISRWDSSFGLSVAAGSPACEPTSLVTGRFSFLYNDDFVVGCPDKIGGGDVLVGAGLAPLNTAPLTTTVVGDRKGAALTVGRFNNDAYDDLAIGSPGRNTGKGAALVCFGSVVGLNCTGGKVFTQNKPGVPRTADLGDHFGSSLLAVDWNLDGFQDLGVGIPDEDSGGLTNNGLVQSFLSNGTTLTPSLAYAENAFLPFQRQSLAQFSFAMSSGDYNGNGMPDIAISAPGATVNGVTQAGVVHTVIR